MTQAYTPDWSDEELPRPADELAELDQYYSTHDTSGELAQGAMQYQVQRVFRVVNAETNEPIQTGGYQGRQHVYLKESTARGVVTQKNNYYIRTGIKLRLKVQVADAEWRDLT